MQVKKKVRIVTRHCMCTVTAVLLLLMMMMMVIIAAMAWNLLAKKTVLSLPICVGQLGWPLITFGIPVLDE
jgi:hypothetical protein